MSLQTASKPENAYNVDVQDYPYKVGKLGLSNHKKPKRVELVSYIWYFT